MIEGILSCIFALSSRQGLGRCHDLPNRNMVTMPVLIASGRVGQWSIMICRPELISFAGDVLPSGVCIFLGFFTLFGSPWMYCCHVRQAAGCWMWLFCDVYKGQQPMAHSFLARKLTVEPTWYCVKSTKIPRGLPIRLGRTLTGIGIRKLLLRRVS